jgi:hypothetical protein
MLKLEVVQLNQETQRVRLKIKRVTKKKLFIITYSPLASGNWEALLYLTKSDLKYFIGKDPFEALANLEIYIDRLINEGRTI